MATLTIKNVPEALVRRLKRQAVAHRRSLNLEVIACLEQVTQSVPFDPETILARARAVRVQPRVPVTDRLLARLKAEGRP
jgi:plasmid stability protein